MEPIGKSELKGNELGFITCSACHNKVLRVFLNKESHTPVIYRDNFKQFMNKMSKELDKINRHHQKHQNHIRGPISHIVIDPSHYRNSYNSFTHYNTCGYCVSFGVIIGDLNTIITNVILGHRPIKIASAVNGIDPKEIVEWVSAHQETVLSVLMSGDFKIGVVPNTNLYYSTFKKADIVLKEPLDYNIFGDARWNDYGVTSLFTEKPQISAKKSAIVYEYILGYYNRTHSYNFHFMNNNNLKPLNYNYPEAYLELKPKKLNQSVYFKTSIYYDYNMHGNNYTQGFIDAKFPKEFWLIDRDCLGAFVYQCDASTIAEGRMISNI